VLSFSTRPARIPGIGAEERGQSEAIARVIAAFAARGSRISRRSSAKAAAVRARLGVANRVLVMEYGTYSVISPEARVDFVEGRQPAETGRGR